MSGVVKVVEKEGRGRCLVASEAIKGGQVILRESPILIYPTSLSLSGTSSPWPSWGSNWCCRCWRSQKLVHCCPNCKASLFCSPVCQSQSSYDSHTPWICKSMSSLVQIIKQQQQQQQQKQQSPSPYWFSFDSSSDLQLLESQILFLIAAYNLATISPDRFHLLLSLEGDGAVDREVAAAAPAVHSFLSSLSPPPPVPPLRPNTKAPYSFGGFSPELTAALLAKDKRNAFGLMEPFTAAAATKHQRSVRAYAIYPTASFFNHDCLPNACHFDYIDTDPSDHNTDIIVRAIHDIDPGKEICLSYFPVNWRYVERQSRLEEDYGFVCDCDRCQVESSWRDEDEEDDVERQGQRIMDEDGEETTICADDEDDEHMEASEEEEEKGGDGCEDFPHCYFFVRYMCQEDNCGGTLAPLPPSTDSSMPSPSPSPSNIILECNVCGLLRTERDQHQLADGSMLDD